MEKLRRYAEEHGDRRKLPGAVAIATGEVKASAVKRGFFVPEQSGGTVKDKRSRRLQAPGVVRPHLTFRNGFNGFSAGLVTRGAKQGFTW